RQPVERPVLPLVVRPGNLDGLLGIIVLDPHVRVIAHLQLAFGSFHADLAIGDGNFDIGRVDNGLFANSRHRGHSSYHTVHNSSPPSRWLRAWRSLMTPRLVLRIEMPRPSRTGLSCWCRR